jgi:hypothetical protein
MERFLERAACPRVTVQLHPGLPVELGLRQPPASKETRMNNLLKELHLGGVPNARLKCLYHPLPRRLN